MKNLKNTVKKMQYLYISEKNEVQVKQIEEGGEFNVGDALGCSDMSYLSSPRWHEQNREKLREQALHLIKQGKPNEARELIDFTQGTQGTIQRRGLREEFTVSKIPEKITGGKKIYVAWKKRSKVSLEECSHVAVILSVCMEKVLRENKRGQTIKSNQYFTYKGPCILFTDWEPKEFKFPSLTERTNDSKTEIRREKRLFLTERDFLSIFQAGQNYLQQREYQRQLAQYNRQEGKNYLFTWLKSEEVLTDIEDHYREVLKRFLFPVAEQFELYEPVKKRVMQWQEEDKIFHTWLKENGGVEKWKLSFVPLPFKNEEKEGDDFFLCSHIQKKKEELNEEYVINPNTGRKIKKGSSYYLQLVREGKLLKD